MDLSGRPGQVLRLRVAEALPDDQHAGVARLAAGVMSHLDLKPGVMLLAATNRPDRVERCIPGVFTWTPASTRRRPG